MSVSGTVKKKFHEKIDQEVPFDWPEKDTNSNNIGLHYKVQ